MSSEDGKQADLEKTHEELMQKFRLSKEGQQGVAFENEFRAKWSQEKQERDPVGYAADLGRMAESILTVPVDEVPGPRMILVESLSSFTPDQLKAFANEFSHQAGLSLLKLPDTKQMSRPSSKLDNLL